jgi:hypothetical protein
MCLIEERMSEEMGIKGLEFFWSDSGCVGIGNADRTMGLLQNDDLEEK